MLTVNLHQFLASGLWCLLRIVIVSVVARIHAMFGFFFGSLGLAAVSVELAWIELCQAGNRKRLRLGLINEDVNKGRGESQKRNRG